MVKKIQCFEDTSGKLHRDALEAHKADLAFWLKSSGAIADPAPKMLVDWITATDETLDTTIEALQAIKAETPTPAPDAAA